MLDAIRGGETPDVVPETSSVVSYAEFLAVEATLDKRWPETAMEPSTERIAALVDALGEPTRGYPVVHLTGTNGKTSTARMIDALLAEIGLRTGRYTSPHLQRATERINIDNRPVTPERYVALYHEVAPFVDIVDAARPAVEVRGAHGDGLRRVRGRAGRGGRHRGRARRAVGRHQRRRRHGRGDHADRARPRRVPRHRRAGHRQGEVRDHQAGRGGRDGGAGSGRGEVLLERCVEVDAQVAREGAEFGVVEREIAVGGQRLTLRALSGTVDEIFLPLHGEHQAVNAVLALAATEALIGRGPHQPIDPGCGARQPSPPCARREGWSGWPRLGRGVPPRCSWTPAHNPHGARGAGRLADQRVPFIRLVGVLGVMREKDARGVRELEPVLAEVVVTANSSPRAMDPDELGAIASEVFGSDRVSVAPSLARAVEEARELAEEGGESGVGVIVTGSVVTAGETRTLFGLEPA